MNYSKIIKHIINTIISVSEHTDEDFETLRYLFCLYEIEEKKE